MKEFNGCPECGSQELEAMDLDEDNERATLVCTDCGHEFEIEVETEETYH